MRLGSIFTLALLLPACGGASSDPGLLARLRVAGAQYVPGALPSDQGGPGVVAVENPRNFVRPGERERRLRGALEPGATGVVIGLADDPGYWIVPAGAPDAETPDYPSFDA